MLFASRSRRSLLLVSVRRSAGEAVRRPCLVEVPSSTCSGSAPAVWPARNWSGLVELNGYMAAIHGVCANVNGPGVSAACAGEIGPVPNVPSGPSRPSFVRMAMMPSAAARPTEMPSALLWLSGIAATSRSARCRAGRPAPPSAKARSSRTGRRVRLGQRPHPARRLPGRTARSRTVDSGPRWRRPRRRPPPGRRTCR